jgi:hypothetical protein
VIKNKKFVIFIILAVIFLVSVSCAPGNSRFVEKAAGFWSGLWHGLICVVTFIISLFSDNVHMYEVNNSGNWYNLGFLIGVMIIFGGGSGQYKCTKKKKSYREKEWEEIGYKVENKVRKGIKNWVEEGEDKDTDWEEIGRKIEEKIKRELKNWAEK